MEDVQAGRAELAVAVGAGPSGLAHRMLRHELQTAGHPLRHPRRRFRLMFPHHENEIAQSSCAHDGPYVNYWMHSGMVMIDKEKVQIAG